MQGVQFVCELATPQTYQLTPTEVAHGEYTADYAITLIEDNQRYGWLSNAAKDYFYEQIEPEEEEPIEEEPTEEAE